MKTKQTSIVLCIGRYGGIERYADLSNQLSNGWLVNRVDYIYTTMLVSRFVLYIF